MSVTTTSGRCWRTSASASVPVRASRDDLEVGLDVEQRAQRAEHHRLILGDQDADHDAITASRGGAAAGEHQRQAGAAPAVAIERAAERGDAGPHP